MQARWVQYLSSCDLSQNSAGDVRPPRGDLVFSLEVRRSVGSVGRLRAAILRI